jgi:uncharacterized membrane protein YagU involved in acid resistance
VARGLLAGAIGTAAMTSWQELSSKLQSSSDGQSEEEADAPPADPWEQAPAPAQVARRIAAGLYGREIPAARIAQVTNAMHWSYGVGQGALYGLWAGTTGRSRLRDGLVFGSVVWALSYVQLVPMGLYEPPWKYEPSELAMDLSYHLVYGAGVAAGYRMLPRG